MHRKAILTTLLLSLLATGANAQDATTIVVPDSTVMHVGDVLRVAVWREPTLSGDFPVDEMGFVSLPMIGRHRATGIVWSILRDSLLTAFKQQIITPSIQLIPMRRVYVLGSVLRPGVYMLDPTFGLEGAISLAGGAGIEGNIDRIRVLRDGKIYLDKLALKTSRAVYDIRSGDQLVIARRSWFDRNSTLLLTSFISVAGIYVTLATRK